MREYEISVVYSIGEDTLSKAREQVKGELDRIEAKVLKEEDMSARDLAYPIKKQTRGHYILYNVEMDPLKVNDLDRAFKLTGGILKFLFVKKE